MITPLAAAELVRLDYREPDKLDTLARMVIDGVQSRIVRVTPPTEATVEAKTDAELAPDLRALIVTGTNERRIGCTISSDPDVAGRRRNAVWHRGFFNQQARLRLRAGLASA